MTMYRRIGGRVEEEAKHIVLLQQRDLEVGALG